jgi:hypothetical protein
MPLKYWITSSGNRKISAGSWLVDYPSQSHDAAIEVATQAKMKREDTYTIYLSQGALDIQSYVLGRIKVKVPIDSIRLYDIKSKRVTIGSRIDRTSYIHIFNHMKMVGDPGTLYDSGPNPIVGPIYPGMERQTQAVAVAAATRAAFQGISYVPPIIDCSTSSSLLPPHSSRSSFFCGTTSSPSKSTVESDGVQAATFVAHSTDTTKTQLFAATALMYALEYLAAQSQLPQTKLYYYNLAAYKPIPSASQTLSCSRRMIQSKSEQFLSSMSRFRP